MKEILSPSSALVISTAVVVALLACMDRNDKCFVAGAPMEDLVSELPGQSSLMGIRSVELGTAGFRQYAGYVTVDEAAGSNFFYYFVQAAHPNASSLPLVLWLNGGPGCSSVGVGGFSELGPFYPNRTGDGLRANPYSWNKLANLLFLESPAGVGFSYSMKDDYTYDDKKVAMQNVVFMRRWLEKFPEYKNNKIFITGESYAGHYIPELAYEMVKAKGFNIRGIMMGNPLLNYETDIKATYSFLWSHGVISDSTYMGITNRCEFTYSFMHGEERPNILDHTKKNQTLIKEVTNKNREECLSYMGSANREMGNYINIYDVTADVCAPSVANQAILLQKLMGLGGDETTMKIDVCVDDEVLKYLNEPSVQAALHANPRFNPYAWEPCSSLVNYENSDHKLDMSPIMAYLVEHQVAVWVYSGDQDSVVPLTGSRSLVGRLARQLRMNPIAPYRPWFSLGQVGGWYEAYGDGKLLYATVRGASHMVPYAQPQRALLLFASFLDGVLLPSEP